ncbi:sugar phosphate isomerase/epimerase [Polaromonas sp. P1(28)-13]|nr:sugar phosphate isomerase/epimerase [Polaromonas sp. P1(28)-13]
MIGDAAALRALRQHADDVGIAISNISAYHLYPEMDLDSLRPVIEAGAALGCKTIVATCQDPDLQHMACTLGLYGELAGQAGLRLAIENVAYSETNTIAKALRVADAVNRDNVGLLVDPLHLARSGERPSALAGINPRRFIFIQLCDAAAEKPAHLDLPAEARTSRLFPGEGGLPLADFIRMFPPGIEIEVETPTIETAALSGEARAQILFDKTQQFLLRHPLA